MIVGKLYTAERHHHIAFSSQEMLACAVGCGYKILFLTETAMSTETLAIGRALRTHVFGIRAGTTIIALENRVDGWVKVFTGEGYVCWLQNVGVWTAAFREALT